MEERKQTTKCDRRTRLRLVGLILGIVGVVAGFPASFLSCLGAIQLPWSLQLSYIALSWLIHSPILLVACKWALVGGALLILDTIFSPQPARNSDNSGRLLDDGIQRKIVAILLKSAVATLGGKV